MFAASYTPPRRNRVAWWSSAALHLIAALLIIQFRGEIFAPPSYRTRATLVFTPRPTAPPKPVPRVFKLPKPPAPQPALLPGEPALIDPPVAILAPLPAVRPITPIQAPPPPPQMPRDPAVKSAGFPPMIQNEPNKPAPISASTTPAVKSAGFSQIIPNEPGKPAPANTRAAGFGGVEAAPNGSRNSQPVNSTGNFDSATTTRASGISRTSQSSPAGFGDAVSTQTPPPTSAASPPQPLDSTPVEITYQPRPAYTDEARRLQIEGEVLVEAVFTASGEIQIVRIARGLGHGLNESAMAAVRSIRFRPARHRGRPADSTATVRVRFELAY